MDASTCNAILIGALAIALVAAWRLGYQRRESDRIRRSDIWSPRHD